MSLKKLFYWGIFYAGSYLKPLTNRPFKKCDIKKILIIAIGEIGDILRLFPFFEALRKNFSSATINLLISLPANHDVWNLLPTSIKFDEKIQLDINGAHQGILAKLRIIRDLRKKGFDLTIDTSRGDGMVPNSLMSFLIGSKHRVGFQKAGVGFLHTVKVNFREDEYIGEQNLRLLESIGIQISSSDIHIHLQTSEHYINDFITKLKSPIISLHPGAKWNGRFRCWLQENYAELIKTIIKEYNATIVLLGDSSENKVTSNIANTVGHPNTIDIAGQTKLSEAATIIKYSHLFIGNDSSLLHLAVALKTPAVGIFGPTSPKQVLPASPFLFAISQNLDCSPCYFHQPIYSPQCTHKECLSKIQVKEVMAAVKNIMNIHYQGKSVHEFDR